ncbi:MAG TPA: tagaturonate reductase [Flavisolibacter sp.]|nr:tagaturonate reductase [Flavisolibacter sp.]
MKLSRYTLKNISSPNIVVPDEDIFELPEKVLQFGTGVLLRGLPDYFIDKANRQGVFNGRVVVVKSTSQGDSSSFEKQDGLFTQCIRGVENGKIVEETIINSSISRVLSAQSEWEQILECAHNRNMEIIISNTTEVGIQLVNDDIRHHPPKSYPGKLLAFLHERFSAFGGSAQSGMVIIPTELIPDNGSKLQAIVLELAHLNGLGEDFIEWLETCNHFCNSLVDRIVPGKPDASVQTQIENEFGYKDDLMIMSEVYSLWAIEGNEHVKNVLIFAQVDNGVVIDSNIDIYRELKLRLLNGTHTLSCGLAFLAGFKTVKEAMDDESMSHYISDLMQHEIASSIPYKVELSVAQEFGQKVLDRFRNTSLKHQWISITMNYSSKLKMRCIPVLITHYQKSDAVPELMALGFAAYIYFMKPVSRIDGKFYGELDGAVYEINDDMAEKFYQRWNGLSTAAMVQDVLRDNGFWGEDLHALPGFKEAVTDRLNMMLHVGIKEAICQTQTKKFIAA